MIKTTWWVDGACSGNPGPGGFGVVCLHSMEQANFDLDIEGYFVSHIYSEYCDNTTNNREELKAILYMLKMAAANPDKNYDVFSDSAYAVNSVNEWIESWARNGWVNSKKKTVENLDLMQEIYSYLNKNLENFQLYNIKGHANLIGNELADAQATGNEEKFDKIMRRFDISVIGKQIFN